MGETPMLRAIFLGLLILALLISGCEADTEQPQVQISTGTTARIANAKPNSSIPFPNLDSIFASGSPRSIYGCRIVDLNTGRQLYQHNIDQPLKPASNLKLFVAATALDRFGPDYQLKTILSYDGRNLWVIGGGDPSTGDPDMAKARHESLTLMFDEWAGVLHRQGIRKVGNIYCDDRIFDQQMTCLSWGKEELGEWYAAPVAGLNFNDNCIDVTVLPAGKGQPMRVSVMPPVRNIRLVNQTRTQTKDTAKIARHGMANDYLITGGADKKVNLDSKPVIDPSEFFADAMRTNFESHGIEFEGSNRPEPLSYGTRLEVLAVHNTKLADAIKRMDKDSQNLFAEAFDKLAGHDYAKGKEPGSWALGFEAVKSFLKHNHISTQGLNMVDGSGLSDEDRVTVRQVSDLLVAMWHHPAGQAYLDSLPIAGVDGTISKRMKSVAGKVRAKTGFILGVRSLSGYIFTSHGHTLAFSIIFNQIPGSVKPYEAIQDRVCEKLVRDY